VSSLVEEVGQAIEPIDVATAKSHCRVTTSQDDTLIKLYVRAARENLEEMTNLSLITKSYRQTFDAFPFKSLDQQFVRNDQIDYGVIRYWNRLPNYAQMIKLSKSPLVSIERISYLSDVDNAWHDLLPTPFAWVADEEYEVGDQVADSHGNLQEVSLATPASEGEEPTSGDTTPSWATLLDATTVDGDLTWTCLGPAPTGDFLYDRDSMPPRIFPLSGAEWPSVVRAPNVVKIYFTAGYGEIPDAVPARALVAILQITGGYYENRETATPADLKKIPMQFDALVSSLEIKDFAPTRG
jgi:hypothetical protein